MQKKLLRFVFVFALIAFLAPALLFAGGAEKGEKKETVVLLMIGMQSPYCPPYVSNFTNLLNQAGISTFMFDAKFDAQLKRVRWMTLLRCSPMLLFSSPPIRREWPPE